MVRLLSSYEVFDGEFTDTVQTSITVNSLPDSPEVIGSVDLGSIQEDGSIMVTEGLSFFRTPVILIRICLSYR